MLVLSPKDIEYCKILEKQPDSRKKLAGALYRGLIFFREGCYTYDQERMAIARCRDFLDREEPITAIIVKEKKHITLWSEATKVNQVEKGLKLGSQTKILKKSKKSKKSTTSTNKKGTNCHPLIFLLLLLML